jgi:hypothetical protein
MDPSDNDQGPVDLSDAIRDSLQATEGNTTADPGANPADPALPPEPEWQAPDWTKRWKPEARDAFGRFAKHPELKDAYGKLLPQLEEQNAYTTRRDQEYAEYRKRFDPIEQVLQPYAQRYALRGVPIDQGLRQLFSAAELLNTDPDQAFPWLAGQHRPRDPMAAINQLARSWGVDLGQAAADMPYVDPNLTALQRELQQVREFQQQQAAGQTQQQTTALVQEISDFESAQDANGEPLHPHFAAVFDDMVKLVNMGYATDLPSAYAQACQVNPAVQQQSAAAAAEAARKKAVDEAAARTAAAEKSEKASRNVTGKGRGNAGDRSVLSIREGYDKAQASLSSG